MPLSVIGGVLAIVLIAWAIDSKLHTDQVARGVTIDERNVSSESPAQLRSDVADVARSWAGVPVKVNTPKGSLDTTLGDLGVALDQPAVAARAMAADDGVFVLARPFVWIASLFVPRAVPLTFAADPAKATSTLADIEAKNRIDAVEPAFAPAADLVSVAMTPGQNGEALDRDGIVTAALDAANAGQRTIIIGAKTVALPPKFDDVTAQKVLAQANQMAKKSVSVYLNDKSIKVDTKTLLTWLKLGPAPDGTVDLQIDEAKVSTDVPKLLGITAIPVTQAGFAVGFDGKPVILDGKPGTKCCSPESIQKIPAALKAGTQRVDLEMALAMPERDRAWAESMKIETKVAEFTTPHACCEPRVMNIQRIADTVRGAVIPPGETFSLNGYVGQRTREKGYVEAPVIYNATMSTDIGGGVSQFAVTTFNAAFFAGLDIPEYQMHSEYISRYPYGREATISWEKPDLKIKNNTPFGVMLWTSYTGTSITVAVYSTPWVKGEQTNQTKEQKGPCTAVTTERTRTYYLDNRTEVDNFHALYQPANGVKC
ncbi:MAG: VanW family protein [Actinobacteria bacterium]|nr:VanW family protein [Actinomycetota bacterium]